MTDEVRILVDAWIGEVEDKTGMYDGDDRTDAWDDVHGGELPLGLVKEARMEEVTFMRGKGIWTERPTSECWDKTGKAPTSVRWVDTNRGGDENWEIRSRLVARDFKGGDKWRDDLFAETPPLEGLRMLLSRAASRRRDGRRRKL